LLRNSLNARKFSALTLVELLVTFTLAAIVATSGFASLLSYYVVSEVDSEARSIQAYLRFARTNAIANANGSNYSVKFLADSYVGFEGATYTAGAAGNDSIDIKANVTVTTTFTSDIVTFTTFNGRAVAAGTITVTGSTGVAKQISVNTLGIIDY
jgi:Tfp pilus assembly protein FimT